MVGSNLLQIGMNQDVDPKFQEKGSYRFALNATLENTEGEHPSLTNEMGNALCVNLPYTLIGSVLLDNDTFVLFSTDNQTSEIGLFSSSSCTYTILLNEECLNFSTSNQIKALFKVVRGCERVIYFTDGVNPYRRINIDALTSYYEDGVFVCDKVKYSRPATVPRIDIASVSSSGQLKVGSYQFAVRYLDEELNSTNFFHVTRPILIYDNALTEYYDGIDGAINVIASLDESGSVPLVNKSIDINLTNVDESFNFVQIAVLVSSSTTGLVSESYVTSPIQIASSTLSYTLSSLTTDLLTIDFQEVFTDNPLIDRVVAHEQTGTRLYVGNLSSTVYDYAEFQRITNSIAVEYVTENVAWKDTSVLGNSKNPLTTFYKQSFPSDEVLDLSVQYLYKDGSASPLFHIPGRAATLDDRVVIPYSSTNPDMVHLPEAVSYEKWQVYNTATGGVLGYYESENDYPLTADCTEERIFPTGKIRHHRTPSRRSEKLYEEGEINLIGLKFSNIVYPSPDIIGHRFYVAARNANNTSTLDVGVISGYLTAGAGSGTTNLIYQHLYGGLYNSTSDKVAIFHSPKSLPSKFIPGSYFELLGKLNTPTFSDKLGEYDWDSGNELRYRARIVDFRTGYTTPAELYKAYTGNLFVGPRLQQQPTGDFTIKFTNNSYINRWNIYALDSPVSDATSPGKFYLAANKRLLANYPFFTNLTYVPITSNYTSLAETQEFFGGDVFISNFRVVDLADVDQVGTSRVLYGSMFDNVFVESTINYELRYSGSDCEYMYTPSNELHTGTLIEYLRDKSAEQVSADVWELKDPFCAESYLYNPDLSKVAIEKQPVQIPINYDYCRDCLNSYPFRIYYSDRAFQDSSTDSYKKIRLNSFTELEAFDGPIFELFVDKDNLHAKTSGAIYFIPTNPQVLNSSESTVYLSAGEVFSVPPRRLATPDYYYAGSEEKFTTTSTEFGTVYSSAKAGKVFHIAGNLEEISNKGMRKFFQANLPLFLDQYMQDNFQTPYPIRSTSATNGVGYISTYDPVGRSYILHKRDYLPIKEVKWESTTQRFYVLTTSNSRRYIDLTNEEYFANKSFTVSYYFPTQKWASFHSYLPEFLLNSATNFFSYKRDGVYAHNKPIYQTYYGTKYPHVVEFVSAENPGVYKTYASLNIPSQVYLNEEYRDLTWTKFWAYNSYQSTGEIGVTLDLNDPFAIVDGAVDEVVARKVISHFNIPLPNDYHTSGRLTSSDWADIQNDYFIDKVPTNIDFNKNAFEIARLKDYYLTCRFYFNKPENYRINTEILGVNFKYTER